MVFLSLHRDSYIVFKIFMRLTGTWPMDRDRAWSIVVFSLGVTLEILILLMRLVDPFGNCPSYRPGDTEFVYSSWLVFVITWRLYLRLNGERLVPLIEATRADWSSKFRDPLELEIMRAHDKFGSFVLITKTVIATGIPMGLSVLSIFLPDSLSEPDGKLVCTFDERFLDIPIKIIYMAVNFVDCLTDDVIVILFWSIAMHLSAQYRILKIKFERFSQLDTRLEFGRRAAFRRLIDRHNRLLELSGHLEDSFSFFVIMQVLYTQYITCLFAFQLGASIKAAEYVETLNLFRTITLLMVTPSACYFAGDYLTSSCEQVGQVFSQSNWHELSKDWIVNLSIVNARNQMPRALTIGKFHRLSLYNFKYTLKAVYSYVSLIVAITKE